MKFKHIVLSLASFVTISIGFILPGLASPTGEIARLFTQDIGSEINIRSNPTTQSNSPHYGYDGDPVVILNEVLGSDDYYWYYVRFQNSQAEGWVRGDFIEFE
ncbi:MAG: SH3 domain-containing protein [Microcoleaceae cyanobacterium]